jgi:hypothetical protein
VRSRITATVIGAAILIGGYAVVQGGGSGEANAWVTSVAGSCTRQASPVTLATAESNGWTCGTYDAANDVCQGGDTVRVKDGSTYGGQTLSGSNSRSSDCLFKPETDGDPIAINGAMTFNTAGRISMTGMHQTIDTTNYANLLNLTGAANVTIDDHTATKVEIGDGASTVLVENSDFGPCIADYDTTNNGVCNNRVTGTANGVTIEDSELHGNGQRCTTDCGNPANIPHSECLAIFGSSNVTFRRNKFYDCGDTAVVLIQSSGGGDNPTNLAFVGNWFNPAYTDLDATFTTEKCFSFDITLSALRGTWEFSWNTLNDCAGGNILEIPWVGTTNAVNLTSSRIVGNVGGTVNCSSGYTADYNIQREWSEFSGQTACGTNATKLEWNESMPYVSNTKHGAFDLHLSGSKNSIAWENTIPTGVAGGCPTDFDGTARPVDSNCDPGSDER